MGASLIEVQVADEKKLRTGQGSVDKEALSQFCDAVLDEFVGSAWFRANVPYGGLDRYERAMCKTLLAYLITQKFTVP